MAQFEVYENRNPETSQEVPYLLDVQADLLQGLATRVVVPLVRASCVGKAVKHLNPSFEINHTQVVMSTAELAGVPTRILGERAGSLADRSNEIITALDFLFIGF